MDVVSRKDALARGLVHFYTGKPCKHGHEAPRYVNSGQCVTCMKTRVSEYNAKYKQRTVRICKVRSTSPRYFKFAFEVPPEATAEQRREFGRWVQFQCAPTFFAQYGLKYGPA